MTSRAREIGFLTVERPETAPHLFLKPSIMLASISTVPFADNAEPRPELKTGLVSSSLNLSQAIIKLLLKPLNQL